MVRRVSASLFGRGWYNFIFLQNPKQILKSLDIFKDYIVFERWVSVGGCRAARLFWGFEHKQVGTGYLYLHTSSILLGDGPEINFYAT